MYTRETAYREARVTTNTFEGPGTELPQSPSGSPDRPYDEINVSAKSFWSTTADEREKAFVQLRRARPITWQPPMEDNLLQVDNDYGYWAITTQRHLKEVTRRHDDFVSGPGVTPDNSPIELVDATQGLIAIDPPRHTKLRKLVSSAFTPRQMSRIENQINANATKSVDNLIAKAQASPDGWVDWVAECGALLPMNTFNDMMGVPDGERQRATAEIDRFMSWADDDISGTTTEQKLATMFQSLAYITELSLRTVTERRAEPQDDLYTALALAEVEGERLSDQEICSYVMNLTVAGNDTTRQSMAHGLRALTTHPQQRAWLVEDLKGRIGTAAEEMIRWATPLMTMRRTAVRDCELDGVQITKGDKLVMFYNSANRDEQVFERPNQFDLSRNPNPHVSFGGPGIHYCVGSHLARYQIRAMFAELLTRCPDIVAGEPKLSSGNFAHVVIRMPCRPFPD
jgi:cytochrome P450